MKKIISFKALLVIFFFVSIFISNLYINKFENKYFKYVNFDYPSLYHADTITYLQIAQKISNEISEGKSFFISGGQGKASFLYPRIIYIFNKVFNQSNNIIDENSNRITLEKYKLFIFFQILLFYGSILFLHSALSKNFNNKIANIISIVIVLNPVIIQWNVSILTESIFISLLIIVISLIIYSKRIYYLSIGLLIGVLYMQRTVAILYPLIIIFYIFLNNQFIKEKIIKCLLLLFGFFLIILTIGFHNFYRANIFYFTPSQTKTDLQTYVETEIFSKKDNMTMNEIIMKFESRSKNIIKKNNLNLELESDYLIYLNEVQSESINTILNNKILFSKIILKKYFHSTLLNPVYVYYESKYQTWPEYKKSKDHRFWLKIRIILTLIFFTCSLIGFIFLIKKDGIKFNIYILLSSLYFFSVSCWLGNTRYFTPTVLFMSIYFAFFIYSLSNKKIKN